VTSNTFSTIATQISQVCMVIVFRLLTYIYNQMKNSRFIVCFLLVLGSSFDGLSQDDRTFWQKLFGKKNSEQIDTESPKNSQDSLATLIKGHLNPDAPIDSVKIIDDKTNEVEELKIDSLNEAIYGDGVTIHLEEELIVYFDTVSSIQPTGFRIQVFLGELNQARRIRSSLLDQGERVTIDYNQSDYIVRVGDYRTFMEAEKALRRFKKNYSNAHVIKDKIKI